MIRRTLIGAVLALSTSAAFAADLPAYEASPEIAVTPSSTWTGGYVGAQGGYGWGHADNKDGFANTKPRGGVVGAFAGYNHQFDGSPVVVGVETDINYVDMDKNRRNAVGGVVNDQDWSGATRGRIGYAADRVLVYGAAGVAYGDHDVKTRQPGFGTKKDSKTAVGYTVGAGVEALVTDNVTARLDYRYNDLGTDKFKAADGGTFRSKLTENRVTGGVAYKFSTGY